MEREVGRGLWLLTPEVPEGSRVAPHAFMLGGSGLVMKELAVGRCGKKGRYVVEWLDDGGGRAEGVSVGCVVFRVVGGQWGRA